MSARLTLAFPASLTEIRAWADRAEKMGVDPHAAVTFTDTVGRLCAPVSARRILLPPATFDVAPQAMKPAKRARP